MPNIDRRLSELERKAAPREQPAPVYIWHGGRSNERPANYDGYDWLYICVQPTGRELYICAADKGQLDPSLTKEGRQPCQT